MNIFQKLFPLSKRCEICGSKLIKTDNWFYCKRNHYSIKNNDSEARIKTKRFLIRLYSNNNSNVIDAIEAFFYDSPIYNKDDEFLLICSENYLSFAMRSIYFNYRIKYKTLSLEYLDNLIFNKVIEKEPSIKVSNLYFN
jgi:hypothetical protein